AYVLFRRAVEPFVRRGSPDPADPSAGRGSPDPADRGDLRSDARRGQETRAEQAEQARAEQEQWHPVSPAKWPPARLAARRREIGAAAFARAYRLVCIPDEDVPIKAAWVQFWINSLTPTLSHRGEREQESLPSPPSWGRGVGGEGVYETVILSID